MKLTVTITPGGKTTDTSDNTITHINGGSGNPNGYDIQNGVIVAIGSNVHVWLTPDSPDGAIKGDFVPKSDSASQIHYYTSSGNANTDDSAKGHTDIFVVGDHTGGYYQQSDWPNSKYNFVSLKGITGNGNVTEGDVGKDYIFVQGNSEDYKVTGVPHPQNHQNNDIDNLQITDENGKHPFENANHIEGVVFGDGPSSSHGGSTTTSYTVTLNLDVNLESSDSNDHLNAITVGGIPEHATFSGNYTDVTYDAVNKVYVLTFASDTTHYSGQVSVELPDGKSTLGNITLDVDSTASDQLEHHFTFDGEEGGQHISDSHSDGADVNHLADTSDETHMTLSHIADESHSDSDSLSDTDSQARMSSNAANDTQTTEADHSLLTDSSHSASLIDDTSLMLTPLAADNTSGHAETPTASADIAMTPLSAHAQEAAANTSTTAVDNDQQLNFSDIIHDEEHHDLSSLIQAGPQSETANNPTEAEHVPAEGGMTANTDSYDAGHEAMVDNLISKPEETT